MGREMNVGQKMNVAPKTIDCPRPVVRDGARVRVRGEPRAEGQEIRQAIMAPARGKPPHPYPLPGGPGRGQPIVSMRRSLLSPRRTGARATDCFVATFTSLFPGDRGEGNRLFRCDVHFSVPMEPSGCS